MNSNLIMTRSKKNLRRIEEIDITRGIAIILVVVGHLVWANGFLYAFIYSFHMPVFFFLSGYCNKLHKNNIKFTAYLWRHIKTLLVPCFIFRIIQVVTKIYIPTSKAELIKVFFSPLLEWFCPVLFLSGIILWFYHFFITKLKYMIEKEWLYIIPFIIIGITPPLILIYAEKGYHGIEPFPFRLDSCLIAFSFMLIGYHLYEFNIFCRLRNAVSNLSKIKLLAVILLSFIVTAPFIYNNSYVNVYDACLGKSDLLFYVLAITGIFYCLISACIIKDNKSNWSIYFRKILLLSGKHSLFIYFGHGFIFQMYHKILIRWFHMDWWPMNDQHGTGLKLFYFISSFMILLLIIEIQNQIITKFKAQSKHDKK